MIDETKVTDKEPSVMEYFILALIGKAGLTSLYDFQQRAGLQPGGIRSALGRLESWQLITRGESSARRRRAMSLTAEGMDFLNRTWQRCLGERTDTEGVLRAACVALLMSTPKHAIGYLQNLASDRRSTAQERSMEVEKLQKTRKDPLSTYAWMRALTEAQRRSAESTAFSQLSHLLEGKHQPDVEHQP